jgi:hypothetical protein
MSSFRYTNPTSSNWNVDLYSKQVGGDKCNEVCKKKCKKNCSTLCQISREDKTDFKAAMASMKEKRDKLKEKLKDMEVKEKEYEQNRINYLLQNTYGVDSDILRKLKKDGGTRRRRNKRKTKKGGFNWFSNSFSLAPCEKSCSDKCESQCKPICTDAAYLSQDSTEYSNLKNEIKIMELSIERIESKLNL